jgi:tetratricopeptide (TPR) repeat protein
VSALLAEMFAAPDDGPPPAPPRPGSRVGRFELGPELGRGGFGAVFEARDLELGRRVALKVLRARGRARAAASEELLRREASAIAQLSHPNIVTLFDAGRSEHGPYLVLELLRGEPLAARLARGRILPREAVRVALAVARALEHAHATGVLHRDLKPANVFLCRDGGVKVLDFGLAHVFGRGGPTGSGTPGYMAPEQRAGGMEDARTDLHALGVLLREMLGGAAPSRGGPPPRPGTAAEAVALAARLAAPDPAARPRDAAEAAAALEAVRDGLERPARRAAVPSPRAVEALRHLFLGETCVARPAFGQECGEHFRRAAELDPTLAAAHHRLALWLRDFGGSLAEQRAAIARALRHEAGLPAPDRHLVRAFAARASGDDPRALALLKEATERWPADERAHYQAGDLLRHQDELELALPFLEAAAALAPDQGWAPGQLAEVLGALGREEALRGWLARWEEAPSPVTLHALSIGAGWLGDLPRAEEAARRGAALGAGLVAQQDLLGVLVFSGRLDEAEALGRALSGRGSPVRRMGAYALAAVSAYRGDLAEAVGHLDALARERPEVRGDALYLAVRGDLLAGLGEPGPVREAAVATLAIDPRAAAGHAVTLAWLGDREGAADLAARLRPGTPLARAHAALAAWHAGAREEAVDALARLAAEAPISAWRLAPAFLHADLARRAGRPEAGAAAARARRLYVPRMMWRAWAAARLPAA